MKALQCEMCGSQDMVKQDGYFVCQHCGTKYSVEEAKKMMIEGTVDVKGVVRVDDSEELKKLYQAARNARETSDDETALKHYETISAKDPDSWEALFYLSVLKTNSIKNGEIASAAISVANSIDRVFQLIKENVEDEEERRKAVEEVFDQCNSTATWLTSASHSFYDTITKGNGLMILTGVVGAISSLSSTGEAILEDQTRCLHITNIVWYCGTAVETYFGTDDEFYKKIVISALKKTIYFDSEFKKKHGSHIYNDDALKSIKDKIKEYEPEYNAAETANTTTSSSSSSGGCYVATAVYGSYDCPEVWTLRRFRDYTLAKSFFGRLFIRTYYAISPTLVKWFGKTEWFKNLWKPTLDKMVAKLNADGVEDTPYEDKIW